MFQAVECWSCTKRVVFQFCERWFLHVRFWTHASLCAARIKGTDMTRQGLAAARSRSSIRACSSRSIVTVVTPLCANTSFKKCCLLLKWTIPRHFNYTPQWVYIHMCTQVQVFRGYLQHPMFLCSLEGPSLLTLYSYHEVPKPPQHSCRPNAGSNKALHYCILVDRPSSGQ